MTKQHRQQKSTTALHFFFFLSLFVWLPLPLGSNRIWAGLLFVALSSLLFSFTFFRLLKKANPLPLAFKRAWPVTALILLAQLVVALQLLAGTTISRSDTLYQLLLGCGYLAFYLTALLVINSPKRLKTTLYIVVASGTFQAIYGGWMTLSGSEYLFILPKEHYLGTATGTFINRNHFAGYLVLCLSLGIGLMLANLSPSPISGMKDLARKALSALLSHKIIIRAALAIMVIGLVLSHSRMGNSSFFIALTITAFIYLITQQFSRQAIVLFISLLAIDLFIVGAFFGVDKVVDRLNDTSTLNESRDEVDRYAYELFKDNLILGTGAGTFITAFPAYRQKDITIFYDHAHNDYLEFISERGVLGTLPLAVAVVLSFIVALKTLVTRKNPIMKGTAFGCIMSITALMIHSTVDFNLNIPTNSTSFMLVITLAWISYFMPSPEKSRLVHAKN
ncbi:MAG: O-antigen ligase family protein [Neptunomonas phycophila]